MIICMYWHPAVLVGYSMYIAISSQSANTLNLYVYIDACKLEGVKYVSKVSRNIRFFQQIYTSNLVHLSMNLSFSSSLYIYTFYLLNIFIQYN